MEFPKYVYFLWLVLLSTTDAITVTVTCDATTMTITEEDSTFGDPTKHHFYVTPDDQCATAKSTLTTIGANNAIVITYTDDTITDCIEGSRTGTSTADYQGFYGVSYVMNYAAKGVVTSSDQTGYATCVYNNDDGTGANSLTTTAITTYGADFGKSISLKFYKKTGVSGTPTEITTTETFAAADDLRICVTVSSTDADDVAIRSLKFTPDPSQSVKEDTYITDFCPVSNFPLADSMDTIDTSGLSFTEGTSDCKKDMNCIKQRSFCFKPFMYNDEASLYAVATVIPITLSGSPAVFETPCSTNNGIGRRRRDLLAVEVGPENTKAVRVPLTIWGKGEAVVKECNDEQYLKVLIAILSGFSLTTILAIFIIYIICKKRNKINDIK